MQLVGCAVGYGALPTPLRYVVQWLSTRFGDLILRSIKSVQPALDLRSDVGLARIVLAHAVGIFLEAVFCALAELGNCGLGLWKDLVEVCQFLSCAFWMISETIARLHRVDQDVRRRGDGPHSVQCIVGCAETGHCTGEAVQS